MIHADLATLEHDASGKPLAICSSLTQPVEVLKPKADEVLSLLPRSWSLAIEICSVATISGIICGANVVIRSAGRVRSCIFRETYVMCFHLVWH